MARSAPSSCSSKARSRASATSSATTICRSIIERGALLGLGEPISMTVQPTAELTIDLGALVANYRLLQRHAKPARVAAGIKANAYGLGIEEAAPALFKAGCHQFFVAILSEAIALRAVVPEAEIYVLSGPIGGDEAEFVRHEATPVLNSLPQIELWSRWCAANGASPAALHL